MNRMIWLLFLLSANVAASEGLPSSGEPQSGGGIGASRGSQGDDGELVATNTGEPSDKCAAQARAYDQYAPAIVYAPADRSFAAGKPGDRRVQADITINKDNTAAVISYSSNSSGVDPDCGGNDVSYAKSWSLKLSFPINDKDAGFAQIATLNGFSSGYSVEFEKAWSRKPLDFVGALSDNPQYFELCDLARIAKGRCSLSAIRQTIEASEASDDRKFADALRAGLRAFKKQNYSFIRQYALTAGLGHQSFDYLTPQIDKKSIDHLGWQVGASASFVAPSRESRFAIGANYQRSYRAGRKAILCPVPSGPDPVECISGALGPPAEQSSKLLWAEARGGMSAFGYSLKVTHDLESDATGVDLPIYLLRNAKGALTGGIRLGWSTEDDVVAGIFLSSPFEL